MKRGKQIIKPGTKRAPMYPLEGWQSLPPGSARRNLLLKEIATNGLTINHEGGIGRRDRDLQRLIADGLVKIVRDPVQIERKPMGPNDQWRNSYHSWYPVRRCRAILNVEPKNA